MGPLVLIVEDEGIIRLGAVDAFHHAGFKVLEAADADKAMELLQRSWAEIRAMFTDVSMPGATRNGLALAFAVNLSWPGISQLLASGNHVPGHRLPANARFLDKPYAGEHATRHVREMIAAVDTACARSNRSQPISLAPKRT